MTTNKWMEDKLIICAQLNSILMQQLHSNACNKSKSESLLSLMNEEEDLLVSLSFYYDVM